MQTPTLPLRTARLVLRSYRDDDVDATLAYYGDPNVARYLLGEPFTRSDAERVVRERKPLIDPQQPGDRLALVAELDGRVIGDLVLQLKGPPTSIAEIGWVFHPGCHGQGYATEAARALIDVAFVHYGLHRVEAQMDARNTASARLCERLGMTQEAQLRQNWFSKGEWTDTLVYGVLAGEWAMVGGH